LFGQLGRATWAPDSQALAFDAERSDPNHILLYRFDQHLTKGALLQPDLSITRDINSPAWSPNGVKMAFAADGRLWVVPVDPTSAMATSTPVSIAEEFAESPSWAGDSRRLVYLTPNGLRRLSDSSSAEVIVADMGWAPSRPPRRVVVHAGQVFDGRNDGLRGQTDIVIENGIIIDVTPHSDDLHAGGVLDAGEETVLPGFIDARTSIDQTYGEALGRIWLAYGITSVRDVALPSYAGVEQREAIANGRRIGPRVFIAGDPFDGRRLGRNTAITSDQQIEPALARAALLGVDFLTMRGRFGGSFERRLADYAHAHGLRATTGDLFAAIAFGFDELDMPIGRVYRDVIDAIGKSEMILAPMLSETGGFQLSYERDRSWFRDTRLALFPAPLARRYETLAARPPAMMDQQRVRRLEEALKPRREAVKAIVAAGGRIVAGTDAPMGDLPYGLSLHSELEQLVLAGMPPFRVLQAATLTAAEALGVSDELGTIEPGKFADLVFLGGDPLQDIRRTRDVRRVMRGGRVYDAASLGVPQQSPR
jgi:imidazolonepropionase-like amidohydrolase